MKKKAAFYFFTAAFFTGIFWASSAFSKVEYTGGASRDPFKGPGKAVSGAGVGALRLNGVVWNSDTNKARVVINGKILKVGDSFKGAQVVSVEKEGVKLNYNGQEIFLTKK